MSSERIEGRATPEGTRRFAERHRARGAAVDAYRALGGTGLLVSKLGFGGYRVHDGEEAHRLALGSALAGGIGLVDTSTNYTGGGSERLVGAVLAEAIARGVVRRDEVVVVSKAGYVQGEVLAEQARRTAAGSGEPELVRYSDDCWHCIAPAFLREQVEATRSRTRLAHVDVLLLHNPEYFLMAAVRDAPGTDVAALRERFLDRVRRAFRVFEELVLEGTIGAYGVSSNTLPRPADDPTHVPLDGLLAAARTAAEEARGGGAAPAFHVLQLPLNAVEDEATRERNTPRAGGAETVLDAASSAGLAVLANRPLNAITAEGLVRLAVGRFDPGRDHDAAQSLAIARLASAERALLAAARRRAPDLQVRLVAPWVMRNAEALGARDQLEAVLAQVVVPAARDAVRQCREAGSAADVEGPASDLVRAVRAFAGAAAERIEARSAVALLPIERRLDGLLGPSLAGEPLVRKALHFAAATPGITSVLHGMRVPRYVEDALAVLGTRSVRA